MYISIKLIYNLSQDAWCLNDWLHLLWKKNGKKVYGYIKQTDWYAEIQLHNLTIQIISKN